jgi:hypothetical protein
VAVTTVEGVRVRSDPRLGDGVQVYRPSLPLGTKLLVLAGPVAGSGLRWYRVAPISLALDDHVRTGWVAAGDRDGTPWLAGTVGAPYVDLRLDPRRQSRSRPGFARISVGDHVDIPLYLVTRALDPADCAVVHEVTPDRPWIAPSTTALPVGAEQALSLIDGRHRIEVSCATSVGRRSDRIELLVADNRPELCADFEFPPGDITITTFDELVDGMVGAWEGCVTTPWVPQYWVTIEFRADGTYSARSDEVLDDWEMTALYYGTDEDAPAKRYAVNDLQASGKGIGQIDVAFTPGQTLGATRDELVNITLMADRLEFEMMHLGTYGPLTFRLRRVD